jgi:hypothetical protein
MKKSKLFLLFALILVVTTVPLAYATGTGIIRIDPALPLSTSSPANFEVWVQGSDPIASDPHILLVMTKCTYDDLIGDVVVMWDSGSISFAKPADFDDYDNPSDFVPVMGTTSGARYTVASLKDHLETTGTIYVAMDAFLSSDITTSHQTFNVTFTSDCSNPKILVYALGKTDGSDLFNSFVPPTIPGFAVPELGTVLLAAASFTALGLYMVRRKKQLHI